jgi:hypothetical protein
MKTAKKNRILAAVSQLYELDVQPWCQLVASRDIDSQEDFDKEFKDYCRVLRSVTRVTATNEEIKEALLEDGILKRA